MNTSISCWPCDQCKKNFSTKQARSLHMTNNRCKIVTEDQEEKNTVLMQLSTTTKDIHKMIQQLSNRFSQTSPNEANESIIRQLREENHNLLQRNQILKEQIGFLSMQNNLKRKYRNDEAVEEDRLDKILKSDSTA